MTEPTQIVLADPKRWALHLSIGTFSAILLSLWGGLQISSAWHFDTFVGKAQAKQDQQVLEASVQEVKEIAGDNADKIDEHIVEFRIANAMNICDRAMDRVETYERSHPGIQDDHDEHYDNLLRKQKQANEYMDCLLEEKTKCDRLRPRL